jgi:hypothetical protein
MTVRTEEELADAIKNDEETIEIEGDLKNKTLKIKATGKVAWIVAIGAISVAVAATLATGGAAAPASGIIGVGAVSVLGLPAATTAVMIAIAAGGVGVLNKLRSYKIIENTDEKLVLRRS